MADKLSVDLDVLRAAATSVRGNGDDLDSSHKAADSHVVAATGGWKGQSAQALTALASNMKSRAASTVERIDAHSTHMHGAVDRYRENEQQRAAGMTDLA
jgi:WXG100 family type VII secretion target